jgi:hypothetical protein
MPGHTLAAAVKPAVLDGPAQRLNVRDGVVIIDRSAPRGGVDGGRLHAGTLGQLLLDAEMVRPEQAAFRL